MNSRQHFLDLLAPTSLEPLLLDIHSAKGVYLLDKDKKKYIDLISGIGVSNIGHRHPKVIKAIKQQLKKHLHVMVYGEYIQTPQIELAKAIVETLPPSLSSVYLVNSGSEAIEGAMKIAKRYTKKREIISCINAYHGSTQGALSIAGNESLKSNFRPLLPETKQIRYGEVGDLDKITNKTAAFVIETVQGEAGVITASKEYFMHVRARCAETDTLLILDEIQCGFGRTGTFWAFEDYDVVPDILVSAKGMGGGMPIGCFIASKAIMSCLSQNPTLGHITTFGGHPISCVASLATIHTIHEEKLLEQVKKKEEQFLKLLKHPKIKEIRSKGLMIALEFESFEKLQRIIKQSVQKGVITDWFLFNNKSMRIAPPLTITKKEIDVACQIILSSFD